MAHWIDEIGTVVPDLSVRAKNILRANVSHLTLFLEMRPVQIQSLRNCGVKTCSEIVALQEKLLRKPPAQLNLFEREYSDAHQSAEGLIDLRKPAQNLLISQGWQNTMPDWWDLETLLQSTNARSTPLRALADAKVDHWCSTTGNEKRHADALERTYLEFRDLPFAARLCGWEIVEAKKQMRPLMAAVKRVNSRDPASLQEEIEFLLPDDPRARMVVIRRALPWGDTLEDLGEQEGVTRERIRQIEKKAVEFARMVARAGHEKLGRMITLCRSLDQVGTGLSRKRLNQMIAETGTDPDSIVAVLMMLGSAVNMPKSLGPIINAAGIIMSLPENEGVTIFQDRTADDVSAEIVRELRRVSRNAGALHIEFAQERLGLSASDSAAVLCNLGFVEVCDGWFANPLEASDRRNPVVNCAGKIIGVSGPTQLDVVWEGAATHARRLKHTLAPPSVIKAILKYAGFTIDRGGFVGGNGQTYELSGAEIVYVDEVESRFHGCASFWDLYDAIVVSGKYSLPALSTFLLRTSPITAAIHTEGRTTLYGIRGRPVDETCIAEALQRQPDVAYDASLSYTLDGFVIDSSVTTWMVTSGVLPLPSQPSIPEENWEWTAGSVVGTAVTSETFLYGFSAAMRDLGVTLGDIVRFSFDVANRQILIQSIQGGTGE